MASTSIMDSLFQRSLDDLIKGLRLQLLGESAFISKSIEEIRKEIKSTDLHTKSIAVQKLTYLRSIHGVDDTFAAFHAVELTSSAVFRHKKIGYLAASLSFNATTDVILLITNQLRKDLTSTNEFEVGLALECLSIICTADLARDLTPEIFSLLSSSKVGIRKKAVATVLRVFGEYPDAVRVCFKRLVENLESSDLHTVSAVVGVFCELSKREPKSYLPLAPEFYKILVDSRNNWVLIKVLKIFSMLAPLEPRLAKRIVEPICEHMRRTGAKSLMFECIRTIVTSLSEYESAVKIAVEKTREFLVEDDPNLKYLGLQALSIVAIKHSWAVLENKEIVIKSLSDPDPNIKLHALRLMMAMVSEDNVAEICKVLVNYALKSDPEFCNEILGSILSTCCRNVYEIIVDFDWYVSLLGEMSRIPHCQNGEEIEKQLVDIGMRVKDVRYELVRVCRDLLIDPALLGNPFMHGILSAAAWVTGEYAEFSKNPIELIEALLQPRTSLLPPATRSVYLHATLKLVVFCLHCYLLPKEPFGSSTSYAGDFEPRLTDSVSDEKQYSEDILVGKNGDTSAACGQSSFSSYMKSDQFTHESIVKLLDLVKYALSPLTGSYEVEVQERASNVLALVELVEEEIRGFNQQQGNLPEELRASEIISLMNDAFSEELGPVSTNAQIRVPVPEGLMLNENLSELDTICGDTILPTADPFALGKLNIGEKDGVSLINHQENEDPEPSSESTSLLSEHRKRHGLYYLPSENKDDRFNEYPPANELKLTKDENADVDELVKLTEQSFFPKKKPNQAKPRPVVVKLDEGDDMHIAAKKPERKDDLISGAVRDVLLGNESIPTSSRSKLTRPMESTEKLAIASSIEAGNPSSRKSKHRSHGKERRHGNEAEGQKDKRKSGHRQGKNKARQKSDGVMDVHSPVIPDFLL